MQVLVPQYIGHRLIIIYQLLVGSLYLINVHKISYIILVLRALLAVIPHYVGISHPVS